MSEYHVLDLQIRDLEALIAVLREVFPEVQVGENLPLYGYEGRVRRSDALVRVDRRHIGPGANDLGVVRVEEAPGRVRYDLVYSEYDLRHHRAHLERIRQAYARSVTLKTARRLGYRVAEERRADGTIVLRLRR